MENLIYLYGNQDIRNMEKCSLPSKLDLNDVSKDSIDKAYNVYLKEIGNKWLKILHNLV